MHSAGSLAHPLVDQKRNNVARGRQAEMLREQLQEAAAAAKARSPDQALTSTDLRGYSNKVQQQAAKAVELPYTLVRGEC